jgi:RNA polymerase sigma factor (sigma-70 family)
MSESATTDADLLRHFARSGEQSAFAELVRRHSDWVYSAAVRMVRDRHLAEDVTQAVFLLLAQKSPKLEHVPIQPWLFKVTRYSAANAIRARDRRAKYERRAVEMAGSTSGTDVDGQHDRLWDDISPLLDELVAKLRPRDRDALLLRFYQGQTLRGVGEALGISADAANKRLSTALNRLRTMFHRAGVTVPAGAALATTLSIRTTHAAPTSLATACALAQTSATGAHLAANAGHWLSGTLLKPMAIAAALLIAAPICAAITWMAVAGSPPISPSAPAAAAAATQPLIASTEPAATEPAVVSVLDDRIAPLVTDTTCMIIVIDVNALDLDAIKSGLLQQLDSAPAGPAKAVVRDQVISIAASAKQWISDYKKAGGGEAYVIGDLKEFNANRIGVMAFPTESHEAAGRLATFLNSKLGKVTYVDRTVILGTPSRITAPGSNAVQQQFAQQLGDFAFAPIHGAFLPAEFHVAADYAPHNFNLGFDFKHNDTMQPGVTAVSLALYGDGQQSKLGFHYICRDAASAAQCAAALKARAADGIRFSGGNDSHLRVDPQAITAGGTVTVNDNIVTTTTNAAGIADSVFKLVNATANPQQP